jgi:ribosomal-protein-alanine N-acetyltransferase
MSTEFPIYTTTRLILRAPKDDDIDTQFIVGSDEDVMRYYGSIPFVTREQSASEIEWFRNIYREKQGIRWVVTERDSDIYIGDIGYLKWESKHRRAEIGYKLDKRHWNKGYMSEALAEVLRHGFAVMDLNRVEALVDPRNPQSIRVLEKQGFKREGLLRDYEIEYGVPVDVIMLSLLRREWEG